MNKTISILRLWLIVSLLIGTTGCSLSNAGENEGTAAAGIQRPTLSYEVNGSELEENGAFRPGDLFRHGMTVRELITESGIAHFSADGRSIAAVSRITLPSKLVWRLKLNGDVLDADGWDRKLSASDHLTLSAEPENASATEQYVMVSVNGGSGHQELNHSYVLLNTEDITVRALLAKCEAVELDESGRRVAIAEDHLPGGDSSWKLKVNGKPLLDSGIDMKLRPQDEVEVALQER